MGIKMKMKDSCFEEAKPASSEQTKPPKPYSDAKEPYFRNFLEKERWQQMQKENRILQSKLRDVKREPPATFHAELGYKSLKNGDVIRKENSGKPPDPMPGKPHYVPSTAEWPRTVLEREACKDIKREQRQIQIGNEIIRKKLVDNYKVRNDSFVVQNGLGNGVDCNERWAKRTSLYDKPPGSSTPRRPASASRATSDISSGVGLAICAGCRSTKFSGADGKPLQPCRHCGQVYYCSSLCAQVDYLSHRAVCVASRKGIRTGSRATENHWVSNRAMTVVRKELRKLQAHVQHPLSELEVADAVAHLTELYRSEREKEAADEKRQQHVEWLADHGMDGPRPCMCVWGKPI